MIDRLARHVRSALEINIIGTGHDRRGCIEQRHIARRALLVAFENVADRSLQLGRRLVSANAEHTRLDAGEGAASD